MSLLGIEQRFSYCFLCILGASEVNPNFNCEKLLHKEFDEETDCEGEIISDEFRRKILICNKCKEIIPIVPEQKICGKFYKEDFSVKKIE